jgi:hypothetical protein
LGRCGASRRGGSELGWASWALEVREVGVSILHCTVYKPAIQWNRSNSAKGSRLRPDVRTGRTCVKLWSAQRRENGYAPSTLKTIFSDLQYTRHGYDKAVPMLNYLRRGCLFSDAVSSSRPDSGKR